MDIKFDEIADKLECLVDGLAKNKRRLHDAPMQTLQGDMLTRIHVNGENSNNEVMNYKSVRHINERMKRGRRTDRKDLQFEQDSLLFGLQVVQEDGLPTLKLVGSRTDKGKTIQLTELAAWQEEIEGSPIWEPSKMEIKNLVNAYLLEYTAIVKESCTT